MSYNKKLTLAEQNLKIFNKSLLAIINSWKIYKTNPENVLILIEIKLNYNNLSHFKNFTVDKSAKAIFLLNSIST